MLPSEDFSHQATTDSDVVEHLTRDKQRSYAIMLPEIPVGSFTPGQPKMHDPSVQKTNGPPQCSLISRPNFTKILTA
jgi:hypothetical protein